MRIRAGFGTVFMALLLVSPAVADMAVHFIDVGQGGAVFIQKDGKNILYDCGDTQAGPTVLEYLEIHDVKVIDVLIPSHAHKDHIGGCLAVMKTLKIGTVYHNDSDASTATWKAFLKAANGADRIVKVDKNIETDLLQILVAYDGRDRFAKEADNSILALLVDGTVGVLLTGDCEKACEAAVSPHLGKISILNVGHHGSNASSSLPFLTKISPKVAVISAGAGNQYGHPTKPVLLRLAQIKAEIYRTDHDGTIVIRSTGASFKIETEK